MKTLRIGAFLLLLPVLAGVCRAYPVRPAVSLEKMVEQADLIIKAKALASRTIKNEWFRPCRPFDTYEIEMQVISVLKGDLKAPKIAFQHYGSAKDGGGGFGYMPQYYDFEAGKTYIVFANRADTDGVFRQLWRAHTLKEDQGVIRAADDRPIAPGQSVKDAIGTELTRLLESSDPKDVAYAIGQLDDMSNPYGWIRLADFDRAAVIERVYKFVSHEDKQVATRAIRAIGAASPYLDHHNAAHWLATVGEGTIPGLALRDREVTNTEARAYWKCLAAVGDGGVPADIRALAVSALGRAGEPKILEAASRWSRDPEPLVRQAAVTLLADFPGAEAEQLLRDRANDPAPEVRIGMARAVGFSQSVELLPVLEHLLQDEDLKVRTAAALSLLSFAPAKIKTILRANLDDPQFKSVFANALAEIDTQACLDALAETIEKRLEPTHFWGGTIPYARSWKILFEYVKNQRDATLKSGQLDRYLDALEKMKWYSSSEPRDLYAFYLEHGLTERARRFRTMCKKATTFDIDRYFDAVDETVGAEKPH